MLVFLAQKVPCPNCGFLHDFKLSRCAHCGKEFSEKEKKLLAKKAKSIEMKGKILGVISVLILLMLFSFVFAFL